MCHQDGGAGEVQVPAGDSGLEAAGAVDLEEAEEEAGEEVLAGADGRGLWPLPYFTQDFLSLSFQICSIISLSYNLTEFTNEK